MLCSSCLQLTVINSDSATVFKSFSPLLSSTLPGPSASEVTTLWRYTNTFIIITTKSCSDWWSVVTEVCPLLPQSLLGPAMRAHATYQTPRLSDTASSNSTQCFSLHTHARTHGRTRHKHTAHTPRTRLHGSVTQRHQTAHSASHCTHTHARTRGRTRHKHTAHTPDLQNIFRQFYDCLTIIPQLRSTYDGHLVYKTSSKERKAFLSYDLLAKS